MMSDDHATSPKGGWPDGLSNPARRALDAAGIARLADLTRFTEKDVLVLHGMGPEGIRILGEALADRGMSFKQDGTP